MTILSKKMSAFLGWLLKLILSNFQPWWISASFWELSL